MRVILANDSFPPQVDGVANTVVNYARIIGEKYGEVMVAAPAFPGSDDSGFPYEVVRYPSVKLTQKVGYRAGVPLSRKTYDSLTGFNADIIHTHCPMVSNILCRQIGLITGAPIILTYHSKFDVDIKRNLPFKGLQDSIVRLLLNNVDGCDEVWAVSRGAGESLKNLGFQGEYRVMPNGVDVPKLPADEKIVDDIREKYGLDGSRPVLLSVGRMMWYKNHRIIADALKIVRDAGLDFRMVYVGDGPDRAEIEDYVKSLGLSDLCVFTGMITDREYLRNIYFCADLLVFPSTYDTNGLVVREAAACGLGSLLVEGSCAAEGVDDGVNGILTEETAESVAKGIINVLGREGFSGVIGANAMKDLYISWEDSVAGAVKRYGEILDAKERGLLPKKKPSPIDGPEMELFAKLYNAYSKFHGRDFFKKLRGGQ